MGKRVGFYLTDLQIKNLKKVSKKTGLTVSEIIRRAVDEHLKQYKMVVKPARSVYEKRGILSIGPKRDGSD